MVLTACIYESHGIMVLVAYIDACHDIVVLDACMSRRGNTMKILGLDNYSHVRYQVQIDPNV